MAGFFTEYLNNKLLDHVFGALRFEAPSTLYVGLSQGSANKSGNLAEPSGGGYARVRVGNNTKTFHASTGGTKTNATAIVFPAPTANWGTIRSLFFADAPLGGNVLAMADLILPRPVGHGDAPAKVAPDALFLAHT